MWLFKLKKETRLVKDILFVTDLNHNLLTVTQMMLNNYFILFDGNTYKIFYPKKKKEIVRIKLENKSFAGKVKLRIP